MKHHIIKLFASLAMVQLLGSDAQAQCPALPPPSVTGNTVAPCVTSSVFTLTTNNASSLIPAWYANPWGGNAISGNSVFVTPTLTSGATYYVGVSTAVSTSSISLPGFLSAYGGNTRGMWFTAPVSFVITGVRVPLDVGGTANSSIAILKFPTVPPVFSSTTNSFNVLYLNQNITGTAVVSVNIPVDCGDVIGLLGARGGNTSYGPTNPVASTIGSSTLTLTRLGMQYALASQTPLDLWQEPTGNLGRMEVYTTMGSLSTLTPVTVTVVPSPQISISGPTANICANSSTTLTAGGVTTYTWFSGSTNTSIAVSPSVNTTYTIAGTVFTSCSSTAAITVSVDPGAPVLSVSASNTVVCSGATVNLNASGATTYTWSGGISNNVPFIPAGTGNYTLQGANSCGTTTTVKMVSVNITPTINSSASSSLICEGESATLTAGGAATYTWMPVNQTGSMVVVSPTAATLYQVTGQSAAGCQALGTQVIVVNPKPTITANTSKPVICSGSTVALSTGGNANTYSWTSISPTGTAIVSPIVNSTFTAIGTFTATGCNSYATVSVSIFAPIPSISPSSSVCLGSAITLTAGGATTFTWSTGGQFSAITVTPAAGSAYTVNATTYSYNISCVGSNTVFVTVNPTPTVLATGTRTAICKNEKTILTASGASTYSWSTSASTGTIQVAPTIQTTYSVDGTDSKGCTASTKITINVSACTGIDQLQGGVKRLMIFPNPNYGSFRIISQDPVELKLINELGQVIRHLSLDESNQLTIEVSGLASGLYFIAGETNSAGMYEKIVVAH